VITIQKDLIKGIIYSHFELKLGPTAVAWIPEELPITLRDLISLKAINVMGGERGSVPEALAILPFPSLNLKGLIKCIEIKDKSYRGGAKDSSLTVLFDEVDDIILYKYITNFQVIFNRVAAKITQLEAAAGATSQFLQLLNQFRDEISGLLNELCEAEFACIEEEEFPEAEAQEIKEQYRFKIIVVGDPAVGKTSLVLRFTDRAFRRTYLPTIGVNISEKTTKVKDYNIRFIIWDIAGQTKFQIMRKHFYGGADGLLIMFDLTRPTTLNSVVKWYEDVKSYLKKDLPGFILGNKNDLTDLLKISDKDVIDLARKLKVDYIKTSALSGENVDEAFIKLGELLSTSPKE
jgi:small GTP-binding protein